MKFRRRLRSRIILSFVLFGTLLSVLFALSTLFLQNYLEDQLIGATLQEELDDYVNQLRLDPTVVETFYTRIQGYVTRPGDPNRTVEADFRELPTGVPWPGCTTTWVEWRLTLAGMILIILGFGMFAYLAYGRMKTNIEGLPLFVSAMVFLVLFIVITAIVFNPRISPYDFIRESDGDGYTDDVDDYPHDKRRYMPTVLQVEIAWENTSTNYTAKISAVYYILDGWPTDTAIMRLSIIWAPNYYSVTRTEEVGTLSDIEGVWEDGILYKDQVPLGLLGVNDTFSFDVNEFDIAADVSIFDRWGNMYLSGLTKGKIWRKTRDHRFQVIAECLLAPADICIDRANNLILVPYLYAHAAQMNGLEPPSDGKPKAHKRRLADYGFIPPPPKAAPEGSTKK